MLYQYEIERKIKQLQRQLNCLNCKDCLEIGTCEDGQVPVWDDGLQMWVCGDMEAADPHDPVTLNADTPTQDSANLVGQELQLVPATETEYGVVKLEDIENVTLNADTPTQDSLNLAGQEIQVNPATSTEYGVVKLEDLDIHDPVTLNADQPTQDAANLTGQELQLVAATPTTYGVVKLEDLFDNSDHVNTYADLPDPTLHQDETWIVLNSTGTKYWNWLVGGTWKPKGFYYSNGVSWDWIGDVPYQATQADVDAGLIVDQFVSPATLLSATTVSHPGHTHSTGDLTDYTENTQDLIGAMVSGNTESGITVTYDDTNGKLDFSVPAGYTDEQAQDAVGAVIDTSLNYVDATPLLQRAALTGEVTASAGSNSLALDKTAISNRSAVTADATDYVLIGDTSDSDNLKRALVSDFGGSTFNYTQVLFTQVFS